MIDECFDTLIEETYRNNEAYFEDGFKGISKGFQNIWTAMLQGDYSNEEHGPFVVYNILLKLVFAFLPNVILLNLTVAILGDSYEETITSISEKCLRD